MQSIQKKYLKKLTLIQVRHQFVDNILTNRIRMNTFERFGARQSVRTVRQRAAAAVTLGSDFALAIVKWLLHVQDNTRSTECVRTFNHSGSIDQISGTERTSQAGHQLVQLQTPRTGESVLNRHLKCKDVSEWFFDSKRRPKSCGRKLKWYPIM